MIILPLNEPVVMIAFLPTNVVKINIIDKFVSSNRTPFTYCQPSTVPGYCHLSTNQNQNVTHRQCSEPYTFGVIYCELGYVGLHRYIGKDHLTILSQQ